MFKLIECPRDAWQGLPKVIPTAAKVDYLRGLAAAGFRHLDAVSFVSQRHVPQMADSEQVMQALAANGGSLPEIIAIVVNGKGLDRALAAPGVTTIGYPHSISPQFLRNNANIAPEESRRLVETMQSRAAAAGRGLVVYVSMAFGNPYGEPWSAEVVAETLDWLCQAGVRQVSLADTVGKGDAQLIGALYSSVRNHAEGIELGLHLHSRRADAAEKILAAWEAGCRRFDCALTGLGGCPFAGDDLVGNIPTEIVLDTLASYGADAGIRSSALASALAQTHELRARYLNKS